MRFKIKHPESDDEWEEEFDSQEDAEERYGNSLCSITSLDEEEGEE